jgi:serine/threonine protein kinase
MLVMEYADNGTLQKYLKENFKDLTWNDKINLAFQLAYAVSCLHNLGIAHRDLVNILQFIIYFYSTIIIILI